MFLKLKQLLDWIYKRKCYCCKKTIPTGQLCKQCFSEIDFFYPQRFRDLKGTRVYIASNYKDNLRTVIKAIKYHNKREMAEPIAKILWQILDRIDDKQEEFVIIPVPLYKKRERERKYNHMELVAQELYKLSGYEVDNDLIKRVKDTKPQYKLKMIERRKNLKNAFSVDSDKIRKRSVLIIDDICTTGSTIEEMVGELNKHGIYNITALVCAMPESNSVY